MQRPSSSSPVSCPPAPSCCRHRTSPAAEPPQAGRSRYFPRCSLWTVLTTSRTEQKKYKVKEKLSDPAEILRFSGNFPIIMIKGLMVRPGQVHQINQPGFLQFSDLTTGSLYLYSWDKLGWWWVGDTTRTSLSIGNNWSLMLWRYPRVAVSVLRTAVSPLRTALQMVNILQAGPEGRSRTGTSTSASSETSPGHQSSEAPTQH